MGYTTNFNPHPETYNNTDINAIRSSICTAGVIPDDGNNMEVISLSATSVRIKSGVALFADGAQITIDLYGVELPIVAGKHYIYCKRTLTGAEVAASTVEPVGDVLILAEVTGINVTDKRQYSAFKVTRGLGNGYWLKKNYNMNFPQSTELVTLFTEAVGAGFRFFTLTSEVGKGIVVYDYVDNTVRMTNNSRSTWSTAASPVNIETDSGVTKEVLAEYSGGVLVVKTRGNYLGVGYQEVNMVMS